MQRAQLLLSGLGGSLFPYLHGQLTKHFRPVYVDADESLTALYPDLDFHVAPLVRSEGYKEFIRQLIQDRDIAFYAPLIDEEIVLAHEIVEGTGCQLISPSLSFSQLCLNKLNLMRRLTDLNISSIQSWRGDELPEDVDYPLFIKPIYGRGSRGIFKLDTPDQFQAYLSLFNYRPDELIVQEYVEGQEYTVGVLANRSNETLCISSRKVLSKRGVTVRAVTENSAEIDRVVAAIQRELAPAGPYNVQLYVTPQQEIKIFEINPRFSTTLVMSYAAGIDEFRLYTEYPEGYGAQVQRPRAGVELRRNWRNNFILPDLAPEALVGLPH